MAQERLSGIQQLGPNERELFRLYERTYSPSQLRAIQEYGWDRQYQIFQNRVNESYPSPHFERNANGSLAVISNEERAKAKLSLIQEIEKVKGSLQGEARQLFESYSPRVQNLITNMSPVERATYFHLDDAQARAQYLELDRQGRARFRAASEEGPNPSGEQRVLTEKERAREVFERERVARRDAADRAESRSRKEQVLAGFHEDNLKKLPQFGDKAASSNPSRKVLLYEVRGSDGIVRRYAVHYREQLAQLMDIIRGLDDRSMVNVVELDAAYFDSKIRPQLTEVGMHRVPGTDLFSGNLEAKGPAAESRLAGLFENEGVQFQSSGLGTDGIMVTDRRTFARQYKPTKLNVPVVSAAAEDAGLFATFLRGFKKWGGRSVTGGLIVFSAASAISDDVAESPAE
jgi:hypothetical protein